MNEFGHKPRQLSDRKFVGRMMLYVILLLLLFLLALRKGKTSVSKADRISEIHSTPEGATVNENGIAAERRRGNVSNQRAKAASLNLRVATVDVHALLMMNQDYASNKNEFERLDSEINLAKNNGIGSNHPHVRAMIEDRERALTRFNEAAQIAKTAILEATQRLGREQGWDLIVTKRGAAKNYLGKLEGREELLMAAREDLTQLVRKELRW